MPPTHGQSQEDASTKKLIDTIKKLIDTIQRFWIYDKIYNIPWFYFKLNERCIIFVFCCCCCYCIFCSLSSFAGGSSLFIVSLPKKVFI